MDDTHDGSRIRTVIKVMYDRTMTIFIRFFRYGSPGQVQAEYNQFAVFYLRQMSAASIETVLHVLDSNRKGEYVAPRVLHQCLLYLQSACSHAFSWRTIKPHMHGIICSVIFPLLKHSDEDEEMWQDDPQEFIKFKYGSYIFH